MSWIVYSFTNVLFCFVLSTVVMISYFRMKRVFLEFEYMCSVFSLLKVKDTRQGTCSFFYWQAVNLYSAKKCYSHMFNTECYTLPVHICLWKVNNRNTRKRWEICSKLTIKTSVSKMHEYRLLILVSTSYMCDILFCRLMIVTLIEINC